MILSEALGPRATRRGNLRGGTLSATRVGLSDLRAVPCFAPCAGSFLEAEAMRSCTNIMPVLQTPIPPTDDGLIVSNYVPALIRTSPLILEEMQHGPIHGRLPVRQRPN